MCYMSNSLSDNHLLHWNLITQICGMILTLFPFESVPGHHSAILPWLALNNPRAGRKPSQACFLSVRERKPCDRREGVGLKIVAYIKACSESHSVSNSHLRTFWQDSRFPSLSKAGPRAAATPSRCEERAGVSQGLTQAANYALHWITKARKKLFPNKRLMPSGLLELSSHAKYNTFSKTAYRMKGKVNGLVKLFKGQ